MDPLLRREVELPPRAHQRAPFYLGIASLLVSLLILLDAALCSHPPARPAARQPAADRAHAAGRLTRSPCRAAARRSAAALDPHRAEFRRQAAEQLANPVAIADDLFPGAGGRYGTGTAGGKMKRVEPAR